LLRGQPKESGGSITQGTSLQHHDKQQQQRPSSAATVYERHELYKRGSPPSHVLTSYSPASGAPPPSATYRAPYAMEQQLSSRQIIMNDYITSQQMVGRRGSADKERLSPRGSSASPHPLYYPPPVSVAAANQLYPAGSPQRTPPPPQQRQGVIQRNTLRPQVQPTKTMLITQKSSPPPPQQRHAAYPPGHEAFSSLVDVASQQPSLPVPKVRMSLLATFNSALDI
jgi:hypothetical protein